jgi:ferredoxin-NADP reductase
VGDAAGPPTGWQSAIVTAIRRETPTATTIRLRPMRSIEHRPGQHLIVRLTAEDGYRASRSYSIASAPSARGDVEITVELLPDGEVSTFLHHDLVVGDKLEVRGPIGAWFTWAGESPATMIGGGSGVVPLMSMLRFARQRALTDVRLLVSVRVPGDLYYASEITGPEVRIAYTRVAPSGSSRPPGHLTVADVRDAWLPGAAAYVCGSSRFADAVSELLVQVGAPLDRVRIERFGATN